MFEALFREKLPPWFRRNDLITATRALLQEHPADAAFWGKRRPGAKATEYESLIHSMFTWGPGSKVTKVDPQWPLTRIEQRYELLRSLTHDKKRLGQRYESARRRLVHQIDYFSGWSQLLAEGSAYQLGEAKPWWGPGNPIVNAEEIARRTATPEVLLEQGFRRIDRAAYIERIRHRLIRHLLLTAMSHDDTEMDWAARVFVLFATPQRAWRDRGGLMGFLSVHKATLLSESQEALTYQHPVLPLRPLYSLPRESNNIASFFLSRPSEEGGAERRRGGEEKKVMWSSSLPKAGARLVSSGPGEGGERGGQTLLFFDRELVVKASGAEDSFISVRLESGHTDVLGSLMKAIEKFDIDPNVFEHLPRVCAGIFAAAHRDRRLGFDWPGTFWDTHAGYRLCTIIGFNPENKRHRKRVQDARALLESFVLHRQVKSRDVRGSKVELKWSGPIIESRKSRLELTVEQREGMSEHHVFESWSVAKELWDMTIPERDGGTPSFMLIDERAFALDDRSSLPFNLYWTLVNRAYMGAYTTVNSDRVHEDGCFAPKLWTLYDWAGMESGHRKLGRIRKKFRDALDAMVRHGLLMRWECDELWEGSTTSLADLEKLRITVQFGSEQMRHFPKNVFLEGEDGKKLLAQGK